MNQTTEITYPYFFLGFSFNINDIDAATFGGDVSNLKVFKRFTYEEATSPVDCLTVQAINVICGTPGVVDPNAPQSICEYKPIKLKDFIACGCRVIPEADFADRNNLTVYINGDVAVDGEDYALDTVNNVIKILWDSVLDTDIFSFTISLKVIGDQPYAG